MARCSRLVRFIMSSTFFICSMPVEKFVAVHQRPRQVHCSPARRLSLPDLEIRLRGLRLRLRREAGKNCQIHPGGDLRAACCRTAFWYCIIRLCSIFCRMWLELSSHSFCAAVMRLLRSDSRPVSRGGRPNISRNELVMLPSGSAIERTLARDEGVRLRNGAGIIFSARR